MGLGDNSIEPGVLAGLEASKQGTLTALESNTAAGALFTGGNGNLPASKKLVALSIDVGSCSGLEINGPALKGSA
jgi:hypothetical protein